ncbi:hypothetical protein ACSSS7_001304 [Eimeria intestinalis]
MSPLPFSHAAACCLALALGFSLAASPSTAAATAAAAAGGGGGGGAVAGGWGELHEVRRHLNDGVGSSPSITASMSLKETDDFDDEDKDTDFAFLPENGEAAFLLMTPVNPPSYTPEESDAPAAGAPSAAEEVDGGVLPSGAQVICEASFEGGDYKRSPTVRVHASPNASMHAIGLEPGEALRALMLDESARYWVHGDRGGVSVPSTFVFGEEGIEGHFAAVHPPQGTGKHRYTIIVYRGGPQLGPLLSSLRNTPWYDRRRAVGSIQVVEEDFEKENGKKPIEVCRCSVYVAYEDLHPPHTGGT